MKWSPSGRLLISIPSEVSVEGIGGVDDGHAVVGTDVIFASSAGHDSVCA